MSNRYLSKKDPDLARLLAVQVLLEVEAKDAFANLVLPQTLRKAQKDSPNYGLRDSAFTSELVYGTIRQRGYLDTILEYFSSRPLDQLDPEILQILRIGAYQLLFMRVPDHAAVSETVDVARELTSDGPAKMVNAVLRSITRASTEDIEAIFAQLPQDTRLAAETSHPGWIVDSFSKAMTERGISIQELKQSLEANNRNPKVNLVARPGLISAEELAEEAEEVLDRPTAQGQLSEYAVIIDGGDPAALPSLRDGKAAVQDEGSQLAALILANAEIFGPDKKWLDLCAGPGGKTALLAAIAAGRGATVIANEISLHRSKLVQRSVQALGNVQVFTADGRDFGPRIDPQFSGFDRVLVDAPCTGLGSLRRRPESRWRHRESDVKELLPLQNQLLANGIELTRPGGVIAWVTCTPQIDETVGQIENALLTGKVELVDAVSVAQEHAVTDLLQGHAGADPKAWKDLSASRQNIVQNTVQLWPHRHGTDAMFIALLRRI